MLNVDVSMNWLSIQRNARHRKLVKYAAEAIATRMYFHCNVWCAMSVRVTLTQRAPAKWTLPWPIVPSTLTMTIATPQDPLATTNEVACHYVQILTDALETKAVSSARATVATSASTIAPSTFSPEQRWFPFFFSASLLRCRISKNFHLKWFLNCYEKKCNVKYAAG